MKRTSLPLAAIALALLAGCYSMDIATTESLKGSAPTPDEGKPMEHVVVSNYGWYLFDMIPLVCGNATPGASFPWKFFSDQVSPELLHDRMMAHAAAIHADAKDLVFFRDERVLFNVPGLNFQIPIPYVFTYHEMQFSAVLTQRGAPSMPDSAKKRKAVEEMNLLLERLNPEVGR